ncbi:MULTISPECIES: hypothetical protein [Providencia]|nr:MULTISPECIES: hypothetical protein [Providencia]EKH6495471.1 hypothetical protein [Providencia rettgeri]ELR5052740.1 hypothetical protein [Providencia rettgeri]ELR5154088.1 hypothetical protein [Providencia rettgeri]ELR5180656.1 hypothetical protein [Providencia rettgeri]ELR5212962.1 hypothetical protein [Providencia rettgeri]
MLASHQYPSNVPLELFRGIGDFSEHKRDILMKEPFTKQTEQSTNTPLGRINETTYLLRSPANAEHLNKSITQFKKGNVFKKHTIEK